MFNSNKGDRDKITHAELQEYARNYVLADDAQVYVRDMNEAMADLDTRVQSLENLARELKGTSPASARTASTPVASRTSVGDALTKQDAEQALAQLKREGAEQFRQLSAKIDTAVHEFVQGGNATAAVAPVTADQASELPRRTPGASLGVDYGAVAFGLRQTKDDVQRLISGVNVNMSGADMAAHYRASVQYYADVFAKSDPAFDADAFKRQAGIEDGGNGESRAAWTPAHP